MQTKQSKKMEKHYKIFVFLHIIAIIAIAITGFMAWNAQSRIDILDKAGAEDLKYLSDRITNLQECMAGRGQYCPTQKTSE